jgi:hypothetical protein
MGGLTAGSVLAVAAATGALLLFMVTGFVAFWRESWRDAPASAAAELARHPATQKQGARRYIPFTYDHRSSQRG